MRPRHGEDEAGERHRVALRRGPPRPLLALERRPQDAAEPQAPWPPLPPVATGAPPAPIPACTSRLWTREGFLCGAAGATFLDTPSIGASMPVFDPSDPPTMQGRIRFCAECTALILSPDWESCRHCGGRPTAKPPDRIMFRAAGRQPGEMHAPPVSSKADIDPPVPRSQQSPPRCESCGKNAKAGTRRCRPCAAGRSPGEGNRRGAAGDRRRERRKKHVKAQSWPLCIGCDSRKKAIGSYCEACFGKIQRAQRQPPRPSKDGRARPRRPTGGPQRDPRPPLDSSASPSVVEPRSERRTQGPIKTRSYTAPENDPRLVNEFAKGMRGRPRGDITE